MKTNLSRSRKCRDGRHTGQTHPFYSHTESPHVDSCHKICYLYRPWPFGHAVGAAWAMMPFTSGYKNWEEEIVRSKSPARGGSSRTKAAEFTSGLSFASPLLSNKPEAWTRDRFVHLLEQFMCLKQRKVTVCHQQWVWCLLDVTATPCGSCVCSSGGAVTCRDSPKTTRSLNTIDFFCVLWPSYFIFFCKIMKIGMYLKREGTQGDDLWIDSQWFPDSACQFCRPLLRLSFWACADTRVFCLSWPCINKQNVTFFCDF